ncbi:MAG: hypothetical protein R3D84_15005 [Paracoccaceae bacterium]
MVFNPWVVVRRDGVTVVTPRAEMGQGVHSALAALVAEEMDLDWRQVRAVHGPAAEAYFNARPAAMALPFAEFPHDWLNDVLDIVGVIAGKRLKPQVTGGSSGHRRL